MGATTDNAPRGLTPDAIWADAPVRAVQAPVRSAGDSDARAALGPGEELGAGPVHLGRAVLDPRHEVVVGGDGRNGDEQAGGRGHQRFGDARRHGPQPATARPRDRLEGAHHADHRSEESHERADIPQGGQGGEVAFQSPDLCGRDPLHRLPGRGRGPIEGGAGVQPGVRRREGQELPQAGRQDQAHMAALSPLAQVQRLLQVALLHEGQHPAHEASRGQTGLPEGPPPLADHGQRIDREQHQGRHGERHQDAAGVHQDRDEDLVQHGVGSSAPGQGQSAQATEMVLYHSPTKAARAKTNPLPECPGSAMVHQVNPCAHR